jgi:hypothetical protein
LSPYILLAEDNAGDVLLVREALKQHGISHSIELLSDGDQAVRFIDGLDRDSKAPCSVERTLLTTGALAALMDSSYFGNKRRETPHLKIAYRAPKESLFNRGAVSPLISNAD